MSWDDNPFDRARDLRPASFTKREGGNRDFTAATSVADRHDKKKIQARQHTLPTPVELPPHIFPNVPLGAQSLDFRKLCLVVAGSTKQLLFEYAAPPGSRTVFTAYALFSDAANASLTEFLPEVDGQRVYPFHGDPSANFKMNLGLSPDVSNNALIPSQLILEPGQVIRWYLTNTDTVDVAMGVRMVGFFDASAKRVTPRFGG